MFEEENSYFPGGFNPDFNSLYSLLCIHVEPGGGGGERKGENLREAKLAFTL